MMRCTIAAAFFLTTTAPVWAAERPNIIMIVADDHAPWAFGAAGHPDARTPNMDRLCREGVRLTNCFVATPVCSASRAALLTSRYPTEVGITDYLSPSHMPDFGLDPAFPVWPRLLSAAGYRTALIGKWHLGENDRYHPTQFGYDIFTGFRHGGMTSQNPLVEIDGTERRVEGWTPDILTDHALTFIEDNRDSKPFCLSLHFWAPHANAHKINNDRTWLPLSEADYGPFRELDPQVSNPDFPELDIPRVKRMTREYLGSIASVDRNVGRVLNALDEWKLANNTVVIYTSDHGYNLGHHGVWHKGNGRWILTNNRGPRPNLWDNSLRTPTMIRWPGRVRSGMVIDRCVTFLDWFPTILDMAGISRPQEMTLRGRSFVPLLQGLETDWNDDVFVQYRMWDWNQTAADLRAFRTPQWKLVRDFHNTGQDEFYDLKQDPEELDNLIESVDPQVVATKENLHHRLRKAMLAIGDTHN
jgi:choline-sulfatase